MRKRHLTLMVIPHDEDQVKRFSLAWSAIWGGCAVVVACFAALVYFGVGYHLRVSREAEIGRLQAENRSLGEQVKKVDEDMLELRERMQDLATSDMQLRQLADLQPLKWDGAEENIALASSSVDDLEGYSEAHSVATKVSMDLEYLLEEAEQVRWSFEEVASKLNRDADLRNHTPSISPANFEGAWVSSPFGRRRDPFTGAIHNHQGLDISCSMGTEAVATADGVVMETTRDLYMGNYVEIDHKYGIATLYGHLNKFIVKPGQKIRRGQVVGYVGMTGRATAPHLHYAVRRGGDWVNPVPFILDTEWLGAHRAFAVVME